MKSIFLKKALSLSLLISVSAPMLAVDKEAGFFASLADKLYSSLGSKKTEVAPVASWSSYVTDNAVVNWTVKPVYNRSASLLSWTWSNLSDNRVVNPVVNQFKQHPYIAAGLTTAVVLGGAATYAYKKGMFSKLSMPSLPKLPSFFGKKNSAKLASKPKLAAERRAPKKVGFKNSGSTDEQAKAATLAAEAKAAVDVRKAAAKVELQSVMGQGKSGKNAAQNMINKHKHLFKAQQVAFDVPSIDAYINAALAE